MLRRLFGLLREVRPVMTLGGRVLVTRHADVLDLITRQAELSVVGVYGDKMEKTSGAFFLGMDDGPTYRREAGIMRGLIRRSDSNRIRELTRKHAGQIVREARTTGRIDLVDDLTREVPIRLLRDYFGIPPRDDDHDHAVMKRWMRDIFNHLFFNVTGNADQAKRAEDAARELNAYVDRLIAERTPDPAGTTLLDRLQLLQENDPDNALDDEGIRRNINGLILGAVDTTSKAAVLATRVLFKRPNELAGAREAARAGDMNRLLIFLFEALRFDPFNPVMFRTVARDTTVGASGFEVTKGQMIMPSPLAAMFDKRAFHRPGEFRTDRPLSSYLHFGFGLHECYGSRINRVTLPEILAPVLADDGFAPDGPIVWDDTEQFPDSWPCSIGRAG